MATALNSEILTRPPAQAEGLFGGHIMPFRRDTLGFLLRNMYECGDVAYFRAFKYHFYQVNTPELVAEVVLRQASSFNKSPLYKKVMFQYLGNGLLNSDGEFWKRQRKLAQPAFHTGRISAYADIMVNYTDAMVSRWQSGEIRNTAEDMMRLTLFIVAKTLFDADVRDEAREIGDALEVMLHDVSEATRKVVRLPEWVPTPARARTRHSIDTLNQITMQVINDRRASGEDQGDLLSMLLMAQDEDGIGMNDTQVRDEVLTLFLAGHETAANALTWTWYLLAQHPEIEAKMHEEIDQALGGRLPTLDDLVNMPYTLMIFKEAMRLYPPAWGFSRQAIEDVEIGGYTIPRKSGVMIVPYVIHRNPAIWDDPERFDPQRFSPENEKSIPRYGYLPFGGGARICIGNSFALMEGHLVLATIAQRFRLVRRSDKIVEPEPLLTLRPKHGLQMRLESRHN